MGRRSLLPVLGDDPGEVSISQTGGQGNGQPSILDRKVALGELLDLKSFRDLCASFVDLYKIGIKLFDTDGTKQVDIRIGNGDWCSYIFSNPTGRTRCTNLVAKIKQHGYAELDQNQVVEQ